MDNKFKPPQVITLFGRLLSWPVILALGMVLSLTPPARAHPPGDKQLYVSTTGQDEGDCRDPYHPCRTIAYALRQAHKGDEIRVAAGAYFVGETETTAMLGEIILIQGGYSTRDTFSRQNPVENPTYLIGLGFGYRAELAERGFNLLQDAKGWSLERSLGQEGAEPQAPQGFTPCVAGRAGSYPCRAIDFLSQLRPDQFSTKPTDINDLWGYVDLDDNREYAIVGLRNGTAVVDVTDPLNPLEVGTIPGLSTLWRDVKVYQFYNEAENRWDAYAYVTAEANQGLQIIDLTNLPESISLAATYTGFASAHNIYLGGVNYTTNTTLDSLTAQAYILGSNLNQGAFRILDLSDPVAPVEVTAPPLGAGYIHDATTLIITDTRTVACDKGHNPCELLIDYNETTVDIWDVTDKSAPYKISVTSYDGVAYTHSGWWTEDKQFVFIQDEWDEFKNGLNTTLRTLDISDLTAPFVSHLWTGSTRAIDHNGFVKGNRYYMSNYQRGLTILDITNPNSPYEVAFFDTYPAGDMAHYNGAWGVYPYLPSGTLLVSDMEGGLILLRETSPSYNVYIPIILK
jgi:choice-of-anchor B domain-containing protein